MEIVVEILLELLGEVLVGTVLSVFDDRLPNETNTRVARLIGYGLLGALLGWASVLLFPTPTFSSKDLRLAWLFVAPVVGGLSMSAVKALRAGRRGWLRPWPLAYGAVLVGGVNLWRFVALG